MSGQSADRGSEAFASRRATVVVLESYNGPASYSAGGNIFSSKVLKQIERAQVVGPSTSGTHPAVVTGSITGNNNFKVQFWAAGTGSGINGAEVVAAANLSSQGFYVLEEGI